MLLDFPGVETGRQLNMSWQLRWFHSIHQSTPRENAHRV
jgi:hypothetical protein